MKTSKGFTIIELLVVIAIIAVLAGIVLVNVTTYINKGKDAAIKGNLATAMTNAAVYFDGAGNYLTFCANAGWTAPKAAIISAYGSDTTACNVTATTGASWCACSQMKNEGTNGSYCVDSTGYKKVGSTVCSTRCPATGACID